MWLTGIINIFALVPLSITFLKYYISILSQLPSWACAFKVRRAGITDHQGVLEFLLSSPVHSPVPYCLYPEDGTLTSGAREGTSPENQGNFSTTRLEAHSEVRTLYKQDAYTHTLKQ